MRWERSNLPKLSSNSIVFIAGYLLLTIQIGISNIHIPNVVLNVADTISIYHFGCLQTHNRVYEKIVFHFFFSECLFIGMLPSVDNFCHEIHEILRRKKIFIFAERFYYQKDQLNKIVSLLFGFC